MGFRKTSAVKILGVLNKGSWKKIASSQINSHYMDNTSSIDLEKQLDAVADVYKISRDPSDYLLVPARANSIGRFNANLDGWTFDEVAAFRPELGSRTYQTYNNKPHFVEHNASRYEVARGVILDSHLNLENPADDEVKRACIETIGSAPDIDGFVEVIIAVDQTKDPMLAEAYKTGAIDTFSMGADVADTVCNICGNVAKSTMQFCNHVRDKYSRKVYTMEDGTQRLAGELCRGTVYQELSAVSDPADKSAVIQDGLIDILKKANSIDSSNVQELISFTARYAKEIPDSLAKLIHQYLVEKGL